MKCERTLASSRPRNIAANTTNANAFTKAKMFYLKFQRNAYCVKLFTRFYTRIDREHARNVKSERWVYTTHLRGVYCCVGGESNLSKSSAGVRRVRRTSTNRRSECCRERNHTGCGQTTRGKVRKTERKRRSTERMRIVDRSCAICMIDRWSTKCAPRARASPLYTLELAPVLAQTGPL